MVHMRISGIEPSFLILMQTKYSKRLEYDALKMPKQVEAKMDHVRDPQKFICIDYKQGKC